MQYRREHFPEDRNLPLTRYEIAQQKKFLSVWNRFGEAMVANEEKVRKKWGPKAVLAMRILLTQHQFKVNNAHGDFRDMLPLDFTSHKYSVSKPFGEMDGAVDSAEFAISPADMPEFNALMPDAFKMHGASDVRSAIHAQEKIAGLFVEHGPAIMTDQKLANEFMRLSFIRDFRKLSENNHRNFDRLARNQFKHHMEENAMFWIAFSYILGSVDGSGSMMLLQLRGSSLSGQQLKGRLQQNRLNNMRARATMKIKVDGANARATQGWRKFWTDTTVFRGSKVYQRNNLFDPQTMSSWKVKGQSVSGTNIERMASGRAPIGFDGKSVNLHHLTQTQGSSIAEISGTTHQQLYKIIHINTGQLPSGINRAAFNTWRGEYWINRASGFVPK